MHHVNNWSLASPCLISDQCHTWPCTLAILICSIIHNIVSLEVEGPQVDTLPSGRVGIDETWIMFLPASWSYTFQQYHTLVTFNQTSSQLNAIGMPQSGYIFHYKIMKKYVDHSPTYTHTHTHTPPPPPPRSQYFNIYIIVPTDLVLFFLLHLNWRQARSS